jgi:hypothetical protein
MSDHRCRCFPPTASVETRGGGRTGGGVADAGATASGAMGATRRVRRTMLLGPCGEGGRVSWFLEGALSGLGKHSRGTAGEQAGQCLCSCSSFFAVAVAVRSRRSRPLGPEEEEVAFLGFLFAWPGSRFLVSWKRSRWPWEALSWHGRGTGGSVSSLLFLRRRRRRRRRCPKSGITAASSLPQKARMVNAGQNL